jgi:hypothetical protein
LTLVVTILIAIGSFSQGINIGYKQGFEAGKQAGIKYEKQRRNAWADSIRNNCKWNNGVPDSVREDFKWE